MILCMKMSASKKATSVNKSKGQFHGTQERSSSDQKTPKPNSPAKAAPSERPNSKVDSTGETTLPIRVLPAEAASGSSVGNDAFQALNLPAPPVSRDEKLCSGTNADKSGSNSETPRKPNASNPKSTTEVCPICLDSCTEPKQLEKCGHVFCTNCIDPYFQTVKPQCPCCFTIYGEIRGNQPENGTMTHVIKDRRLPGCQHNSSGTIEITYYFPGGIQDERHPNPGRRYHGTTRVAYLPNNECGQRILKLLERAFELRQTFTVGQSRTTGQENVITWNDIHHKTNYSGGINNFGYPDDAYFNRVLQELAAKGIQ